MAKKESGESQAKTAISQASTQGRRGEVRLCFWSGSRLPIRTDSALRSHSYIATALADLGLTGYVAERADVAKETAAFAGSDDDPLH